MKQCDLCSLAIFNMKKFANEKCDLKKTLLIVVLLIQVIILFYFYKSQVCFMLSY